MSKYSEAINILLEMYVGLACNYCHKEYTDLETIKDLEPVKIGKTIADSFETCCFECYKKHVLNNEPTWISKEEATLVLPENLKNYLTTTLLGQAYLYVSESGETEVRYKVKQIKGDEDDKHRKAQDEGVGDE